MEAALKEVVLYVALPWAVWVTVSLFNQRQEIAVLKEILKTLKHMAGGGHSTDP